MHQKSNLYAAPPNYKTENMNQQGNAEIASLGGGCFWCTEAIYQRLTGVIKVVSGYSGGNIKNPTYREICSGLTGHAEVIQVQFDPNKISYAQLLEVFFATHDPTTLNRQGNDMGSQYRSVIFFHSPGQKEIALEAVKKAQKDFSEPIVTEISPMTIFYPAEDYHQDYFNLHGDQPYCQFVIAPKVKKFLEKKESNNQ